MNIRVFSVNATRECNSDGTWGSTTNYTACMCNSTVGCFNNEPPDPGTLEISIVIYLVGMTDQLSLITSIGVMPHPLPTGYILSFLALIGALAIYLSFRSFAFSN